MVRPSPRLVPLRPCLVLGLVVLHSCNTPNNKEPVQRATVAAVEDAPAWMKTASPVDQARLGQLSGAWEEALVGARKVGAKQAIAAEGKLLEREAALPRPAPAPGNYMCRLIQLGPTGARGRALAVSKPDFCYVGVDDEGRLWLAKQTGALRRQGYLFDDWNENRLVFLGSVSKGEKDRPPTYGSSVQRDHIGVLERIGPLRFRLVTPHIGHRYKLEVLELTPAPKQNDT